MRFLVPLLLLPLIEIAGFAWVGSQVGALNTVLLVLLSGIVGVLLIQRQGLEGVRRAQIGLQTGEVAPMREMFTGLCLAFAGILLVIPGFFTDLLALILFIPAVRRALLSRMTIFMEVNGATVRSRPAPGRTTIIDGDFQDVSRPDGNGDGHVNADSAGELPPPDSKWRPPGSPP